MNVELQINNSTNPNAQFVSWAPSPCRIRVTNPAGAAGPNASVKLSSTSAANGGSVGFRSGTTGAFAPTLTLTLPVNGTSVSFFTAGKFGQPSTNEGDVRIEARVGNTMVGAAKVMVRIRKNANTLMPGERDRFVAAFAKLNNQGLGRYVDFRNMHIGAGLQQAHGAAGFLPWHRTYILDLERELQAIDPSVALPYWRFDRAAPNIFKPEFMGVSDNLGTVSFANNNPLQFWKTDGQPGVNRRPLFNIAGAPPNPISEAATLALGTNFSQFRTMEGNPHGSAHTSFGGFISSTSTAPRDPLFFLLHCNVDRLWAKWQRQNSRFNPAVVASFNNNNASPVGHRLQDSLWPWNGLTGGPRPPTAPGGTLAPSPIVAAPGLSPFVKDMLDYHGVISPASIMGFDYDDIQL
jgi:tyrosinase